MSRSWPVVGTGVAAMAGTLFGLSALAEGFYGISVWGPLGLVALALGLALAVARRELLPVPALVAVGGLVSLWLWSLLSTSWGESAERGLTEANRWATYAAVLGVLVLAVRDDRVARVLLACATGGVLVVAAYVLARMLGSDGSSVFLGGRLHEPLAYINGQGAVFLLGMWPLVALAERRGSPAASAAGVAGTALLGCLLVLSQSRGIALASAVTLAIMLVIVPGRLRRAWALLVAGCGVALAGPSLTDIYQPVQGTPIVPDDADVREAARTALAVAALSAMAWGPLDWAVQRAQDRDPEVAVRLRTLGVAALAALTLVGASVAVAASGRIGEYVEAQYEAFVHLNTDETGDSRFFSGAGNRYDYWRIAARAFADEPARGLGAGNYHVRYFERRSTSEDVRQPHSIELQVLAELGLVGALGLLAFLGGAAAALLARVRAARAPGPDRTLAVAGGGVVVAWLAHTSVDWLHLIPGLTGLALCGVAALLARPRDSATTSPGADRPARPATAAVMLGACVALAALAGMGIAGQTLADRARSEGRDLLATNPRGALDRAADALAHDDESPASWQLAAAAYARLNRYEDARAALFAATRREPHDFVSWALLGDLAVRRGERGQARAAYRRAARLNPRDPVLADLARDPPAPG